MEVTKKKSDPTMNIQIRLPTPRLVFLQTLQLCRAGKMEKG
jgi:hypothetical protein